MCARYASATIPDSYDNGYDKDKDNDYTMTEEPQEYDESGLPGPGAPTPLSALEGISGLTGRDIKLFVDAGYHTVESIAYTYVFTLDLSDSPPDRSE